MVMTGFRVLFFPGYGFDNFWVWIIVNSGEEFTMFTGHGYGSFIVQCHVRCNA